MNKTIDINQPIEKIIDIKIEAIREEIFSLTKSLQIELDSLLSLKASLGGKNNNIQKIQDAIGLKSSSATFLFNGVALEISQKNIKPLVLDILKTATNPLSSPLIYEILKGKGYVANDNNRQKWVLAISASLGSLCKYKKISMVGDTESNPKFYSFGIKKADQTYLDLIDEDEEFDPMA